MKLKMIPLLLVFLSVSAFAQIPLAPKDLLADVKDSYVILTWTPPVDTSVAGFNIYRKVDAAAGDYVKINSKLISRSEYEDKDVNRGKSYAYICKAVNTDGIESEPSNICGAPKMQMKASAIVTHMGKTVRIAAPGDTIKYSIEFGNKGFGVAKNVVIVYAIPKGTTFISGTANCPSHKVKVSYFDEKAGSWVDRIKAEENISKVRFTVLEDVYPKAQEKNDIASLKVMVNY
jgi:uncharacterized repeat protein (TIGR01451 family)